MESFKNILSILGILGFFPLTINAASTEVIHIAGTGSALGTVKKLGKAFEKEHPGIRVTIDGNLGSSGGIKALLADAIDIAVTSRVPNEEELEKGVTAIEYGVSPFIFVTSLHVASAEMTFREIASIYSRETKNWPDGTPVRLIRRYKGDTDNVYLEGLAPEMKDSVKFALSREGLITAMTDQDNLDMIQQTKGGFGAATLSQIITERRSVKIFKINGVAPSPAGILEGSYPYHKCFFAVTKSSRSKKVDMFLAFLKSRKGRDILKKTGHVPGKLASCSVRPCNEAGKRKASSL